MLNKFFLLAFTLKDLKITQIIHFLFFYLKKKKFKKKNIKIIKKKFIYKKPFFLTTINRFDYKKKTYSFGNFKKKINLNNWENKSVNKLWEYNFFYFDFLFQKNLIVNKKVSLDLIKRWINISYKKEKHTMWDSYPTSIRLINLVKFCMYNKINSKYINESIYNHLFHLKDNLEYRLGANHLLTNLIALNCAKFFLEIKDNKYKKLEKMLHNEINNQFQNNLHFEKTPTYHNTLTEQLIIYGLVKKIYDHKPSNKFLIFLNKLISISKNISHPDGKLAFFNDTNYDSLNYKQLELLFKKNFKIITKSKYVNESSYPFLKKKNIFIITKCCGPEPWFNPGHSHADSLSFEVSINNERFLINKGISTYENNDLRFLQRSTESHNTIKINDKNSSAVWSSFRVGKKSKVFNIKIDKKNYLISASHNGFSSFLKTIIHNRTWKLKDEYLSINDEISGKFKNFKIYYHFSPNVNILKKNNLIKFQINKIKGTISFSNANNISIKNSFFYPRFGIQKRIQSLVVDCDNKNNKTLINFKK